MKMTNEELLKMKNNHTNLCGKESIQFEKRFSRTNTFITNFLNMPQTLLLFSDFQSPGDMWRCTTDHPLFPQGFHIHNQLNKTMEVQK